jgi:hypothetical protein
MRLTRARRETFLAELARHGIVARAARAASPHSTVRDGAVSTFRQERARNPAFAATWDEAMERARGAVEAEVVRRGIEGWLEPVYQRGERVGEVRKYDSRLLELHAKRLVPEYRERSQVELRADVRARAQVDHGLEVQLRALSREERAEVRALLARMQELQESAARRRSAPEVAAAVPVAALPERAGDPE